jgi:hypothetical protein
MTDQELKEIFTLYSQDVMRIAFFYLRNREDAFDVTIDWNFNSHHFVSEDFQDTAIQEVTCLTASYFDQYPSSYPKGLTIVIGFP